MVKMVPDHGPAMMACGHAANAKDSDGKPCCVICIGIREGATTVVTAPDLTGRMARCSCGNKEPSSTNLPFFEHYPHADIDHYYCGCYGWD